MFRSKLFLRLFSILTLVVALSLSAVHLVSVPLIKDSAYEIELNASRTILDNVFELASRIHMNLETHRTLALDWHKTQMRNTISLATSYINYVFSLIERGEITENAGRRMIFDGLRTFKYGKNDYIWITDYNSVLLSHPDPDFQGRDTSDIRDHEGRRVIATMIDIARTQGEGFHSYSWRRLGKTTDSEKISYFRNFPQWGFVIGTGVYLDDVDEEVARRKEEAVRELRQALRNIKIAKTGYVYIFDSDDHMIIHPNANIEETRFSDLVDLASGRPISQELKEVADKGVPVHYLWDKPADPNSYVYEKISWVRHLQGFDWYIASSVYVEELRRSSEILGNRILAIGVAAMVLATVLGYLAARRLAGPINRLAETAALVRAGDLSAQSGIVRTDEIGMLAGTFDDMVQRLRDNIATLDTRVRERTAALEETNRRLHDAILSEQQTQSALAGIEARQRLILDAIPASVACLDRQQRLCFVNRRWAELVGLGKEAQTCRPLAVVVGRETHGRIRPFVERAYAGTEVTFEHVFRDRDGRSVVTKNTLIPESGPGGDTIRVLVLSLDVTDEKETERQLLEAQRLKAVGQLSGGLSHDFNNLLSIILGNLAMARDKFAGVAGLETYLEPAMRAGRRGADITSRLLSFARRHPLNPAPVEVCALVRDIAVLLRRSLPANIEIIVPAEDRQCWTFADQSQLENALVNLSLNARDAMPRGGRLRIDVTGRAMTNPPADDVAYDEAVPAGTYVEIRVEDTGCGFSPEALAKAFEPFFTTKSLGSGLGLSMVYGFVKQSGGYIRLLSPEGMGSVIMLLLPSAPLPVFRNMPARSGAGPAAGAEPPGDWSGRLALLVEDDEDVRQVVRNQMIDLGYSVLEAVNAGEAVTMLEAVGDIDLVVSDIVMSGAMNGLDLARLVRDRYPAVKLVLVSGFALDGTGPDEDATDLVILRKPFEKHEFIEAIHHSRHNRMASLGVGS